MSWLVPTGRAVLPAGAAGLLLLVLLIVTAPSAVHIDVGGAEPVTITGAHLGEEHYGRRIRWTDGRARIDWPGVLGVAPEMAEVELASFPGRAGDQVAFTAGHRVTRHTLSADWDVVAVPVPPAGGPFTLDLQSTTYSAPGDDRQLGVRLDRVSFFNGPLRQVLVSLVWWQALVLVLVGALTWQAGRWLATPRDDEPPRRPMAWSAGLLLLTGGALAWWRLWLLQPSGLLGLVGAALLGVALVTLLRRDDGVSRRLTATVTLACAATWLVMAMWSATHFVDVPRWDIWDAVRLVDKYYAGTLQPADFWSAHNEHRPLTARLVILPNVALAHWNHWYELGALLTTAALLLLLITRFVAGTQRHAQRVHPLALVVVALLVFSATQWENWLRSYHVHIVMGAVAPVAALLLLSTSPSTWPRVALAAALGVLGELSFGSGLVVWPLGAFAIVARHDRGWPQRLGMWVFVSAVAVGLYLPGLPHRPGLSDVTVGSGFDLVRIVVGTLVGVAMPVVYLPQAFAGPTDARQAAIVCIGGIAVASSAVLVWMRWRDDTARACTWLFPMLLIGFGLGACLLAAMGRARMGLYALTASRYIVFSACFWVGLVLLLAMASPLPRRRLRLASAVAQVVVGLAAAAAWTGALPYMDADALAGRRAREALRRGDVGAAASVLYPDEPALERMRAVLLEHQLSLFRPGAR